MHEHTQLLLAAIAFIGIGCQWLAWQTRLPAIIFLLIAGILAGPVTGVVNPEGLFGDLLFPFVSLGVAVILFEGGMTLQLHEIRGLGSPVIRLLSLGALVTLIISALATHMLLGFPLELAVLFGALMTVTGPTVIKPLLQTVRPRQEIARLLQWESIVLDPIGALLTVLVFQFIISTQPGHDVWLSFLGITFTGVLGGVIGALLLAQLLRRHLLPYYLENVFTLVLVLIVFAAANSMQHESGLLAVTLMGMMLANMKGVDIEELLFFKESLSVLLISILFIVLAARLDISPIIDMGWNAVALLAVIMLVARPAAILASTLGTSLDWRARALLSWIAPRGIVAAAVSALIALRLQELGYTHAELLVPVTFLVIIGTVLLQGVSARPLARLLGVAEPEPDGVLIVGANTVARTLARALQKLELPVRLADTGWENVRAARMEGFQTYFGRVVSQHADRHLDLSGIGKLLGLSPHSTLNALACIRFKHEFGAGSTFRLQTAEEEQAMDERTAHPTCNARKLFGESVTHDQLASLIAQGADIRITTLSEDFDDERYREHYGSRAIRLFALDTQGKLHFFTSAAELHPKPGWKVASLLPAEVLEQLKNARNEARSSEKSLTPQHPPESA